MNHLVTDRLRLRTISPAEARNVAAGVPGTDSRWAAGYPTANDIVAVGGYLEHRAAVGDLWPFGHYQLLRRADGLTIGGVGFHGPPGEDLSVSVGYGVIPAARRNGYATEALCALLAFASSRGVALVRGRADLANDASQRVMTGAGMALVAEDRTTRHYAITLAGP